MFPGVISQLGICHATLEPKGGQSKMTQVGKLHSVCEVKPTHRLPSAEPSSQPPSPPAVSSKAGHLASSVNMWDVSEITCCYKKVQLG